MSTLANEHERARSFRRAELASFLRRRRETLRPGDVGLPAAGRRRTPGLRREEVAVLAHVGVSWYTWMEQGRELTVSPSVLDGVADALRLTPGERVYLFELAGATPPPPAPGAGGASTFPGLHELLRSMPRRPAYGVDRYWTVLASNELATYVFGTRAGQNCLVDFFTDERVAERYPFRDIAGPMMVAQFREHAVRYAGDQRFTEIVEELTERSPRFRALWEEHVVGVTPQIDLVYDHPHLGRLSFAPTVLAPTGADDLRLFVYIPKAGTPTADALRRVV